MIQRTLPSAWTAKRSIAIAGISLAMVFALGLALSPPRTPTVAVIGDRAEEVRSAMGATQAQDATVTVVLLNRWDSLRHMPDIAELCWDACHNRVAPQITLTQMRFGKTRKVVVFHLPDFAHNFECVAAAASMELSDLWAYTHPRGSGTVRKSVWILPMRLGRLS
ncbi:hypothetical protein [Sulfitobacter sp.]|uniref:hypothetical protein n=1 Tax=Sulfitobacter sp. TaxID=1903071 RepID=UPI003EFAC8D2